MNAQHQQGSLLSTFEYMFMSEGEMLDEIKDYS